MTSYILGFNCYMEDASAALLKNGEVVAAVQEERLTRKKHVNGGFTLDCAHALVKRCEAREPESRIGFYYQQMLGRNPLELEMTLALEFIQSHPDEDFCITLFNVNEFLYID